MTRTEIIEAIIELFEQDEDLFIDCIEQLDGYNGWLGDDRYWDMCELDELLSVSEHTPTDIILMARNGNFNINDDYFRFNVYGNLESDYCKDYSEYLDEYFVEAFIDHASQLWIKCEELISLIEAYGEAEED